MEYPGAIIFCNANISEQVLNVLKQQLHIHQTLDFNSYSDGYETLDYLSTSTNERVLVLIEDFTNLTLREKADVVIYIKMGLCYILKNNFGPTGLTLDLNKLYIQKILSKSNEYKQI